MGLLNIDLIFIADTVYLGENFDLIVFGVKSNAGLYECEENATSIRGARLIYYSKYVVKTFIW